MKDGLLGLSYIVFYVLDREDTTKDNMYIIEKFFVLDGNYKIIREYEIIKERK